MALTSLRGEGRAVVELHALPELDLPGRVVHVLPRHREARAHLAGLQVARGQVVEDVVAEDDALAEDGVGGIPVLDVALERVDDGVVLGLGEDIRGRDQREGQQESGSQRGGTTHEVLLASLELPCRAGPEPRRSPPNRRQVPTQ